MDGHRQGERKKLKMTAQEGTRLFGREAPEFTDPRILLLDKMLGELPREKQIGHITATIKQEAVWNGYQKEQAILLVEALEQLFGEQEVAAFRAHLMKIYKAIPTQVDGDRFCKEKVEAAPELKLFILNRILQGWTWVSKRHSGLYHLSEDAEACFKFLCEAYRSAPQHYKWGNYPNKSLQPEPGKIRKGILDLFRKYFERSFVSEFLWDAEDFDPWILREDTPNEIAVALLHVQIRSGGASFARERLKLIATLKKVE